MLSHNYVEVENFWPTKKKSRNISWYTQTFFKGKLATRIFIANHGFILNAVRGQHSSKRVPKLCNYRLIHKISFALRKNVVDVRFICLQILVKPFDSDWAVKIK